MAIRKKGRRKSVDFKQTATLATLKSLHHNNFAADDG